MSATRAPNMSRFMALSTSLSPTQCLRLPTSLISSRTGPASVPTTTSVSPSLSMSPNAAPRLTSGTSKNAPACLLASSNRPSRRLRNNCLRCFSGNGSLLASASTLDVTAPLTVNMSSHPSLSTSSHPAPKPVNGRLARRMPACALRSSKIPEPLLTYRSWPCPANSAMNRSSSPSLSKSPASTPMLALTAPSGLSATPARSAVFLKVPSRWLIHNWFCWLSLATKRSIQPSPLKSAVETPSVGPDSRAMPAAIVTSVNVPSRLLWKRWLGSESYTCGGQ